MRIVNKSEFYKMPEGTLFSEYQPYVFSGLKIKYQTIFDGDVPIDYFELDLIGNIKANGCNDYDDILDRCEKTGESFDLDFEGIGRDGLFEEDQLYAIYEEKDIKELISALQQKQENHLAKN